MKHTIRIVALLIFLSSTFVSWSYPIDVKTAREIAINWLQSHQTRGQGTNCVKLRVASDNAYLFEDDSHFTIVSAHDGMPPIIGYGTKTDGTLPPVLQGYLQASKKVTYTSSSEKCLPVPALLPFVRHQKTPYNNRCPRYKNPNGEITEYHCLVGCVATALEEIISYYRRNVILKDTLHGWKSDNHEDIVDILPGTSVDCKLIRNNYDVDDYTPEEADAVARLSYYCGIAAHMNWGLEASGANITRLVGPLRKAFGYNYVEYVDSYKYAPEAWMQILRNELYAQRPVLYTAFNMWMGGHAFVIDGLDENGLFHVNWGYGGSYDGFFHLNILNFNESPDHLTPEGAEAGFFTNHQALLLHPDSIETTLPDTLTRTGLEIAIDSVRLHYPPETGKHTPISVFVRNTTNQELTTPLELFTNLAQDTALLEQADFIALSSATLAPYEQKELLIHAAFDQPGERILRISPDDKHFIYKGNVKILKGIEPQLTFHTPVIDFPKPDEAFVSVSISNTDTAGRSGQEVLYEMGPGNADNMKDGVRHSRQIYVFPGETKTDTIRFRHMEPGNLYTLLVRSPWKVKTQMTFTVPEPAGITSPNGATTPLKESWYTLDGRKVVSPKSKGIYLHRTTTKIEKIYIQ